MENSTLKTGNVNINLKESSNTTIHVDNSIKTNQINDESKPQYEIKTIWDTKTKPIISFAISLIAIVADLLGIISFLKSGLAFDPKYSFISNLILFTSFIFIFILINSLSLLNREYKKFFGGLSFLKRNGKILLVKIKGECTHCGGKLDIVQTGDYAYCKRNPKHKFDFDYTKID